jgi:phenylpropionate dioxygenase-like ring-hydroxylating dioxygenase large terminal subunit
LRVPLQGRGGSLDNRESQVTSLIEPATWVERYPEVAAAPVRAESCTSPEYFQLEKERLFKKVWLCVGREEDAAEPEQYFVKEVAVCDASVLVARGKDGVLRAFHNVCRHRGNKLVWQDGCGSARSFVCTYHGWAFRPDGSLAGVPAEDQFRNFDRADNGLVGINLDVWEGFVFVNFDPEPSQTLAEFMGEFGDSLRGYPFGEKFRAYKYSATVKANWKVALDAFQEFYHVAFIHKRSLGSTTKSRENPFSNPLSITLYDTHRQVSGYANPEYQPTPTELAAALGGRTMSAELAADALTLRVKGEGLPRGVNPTRQPTWSFDVDVIFPNIILDVFESLYFMQEFWPVSEDETYWQISVFVPPGGTAGMLFAGEHGKIELRDSILEDFATLERTQAGLKSGSIKELALQDSELAIRHQYKVVEEFVQYFTSPNGKVRS